MSRFCLFPVLSLLALLSAQSAYAQRLLVISEDGKPWVVVGARRFAPLVMKDGKLVTAHPDRFGLVEGGEFLNAYISVQDITVQTSSVDLNSNQINKTFALRCRLQSDYPLPRLYLALELKNQAKQAGLFLYEVGDLQPQEQKWIDVVVPMSLDNRNGEYRLYFFVGGREVFSSMMAVGEMDLAIDEQIRKKLEGVENSRARALVGPPPLYPKKLRKQKVEGEAVLKFKIDERGYLSDASVVSATQPEFGEAAMAVIRQWRFMPQVEEGRPVACYAQMPFGFTPDEK